MSATPVPTPRERLLAIFHRLLEIADTTNVHNLRAVQEVHTLLPKIAQELDTAIASTGETAKSWTQRPILYLRDSMKKLSERALQAYRVFADDKTAVVPNAADIAVIDETLQRLQRELTYSLWNDRTIAWR